MAVWLGIEAMVGKVIGVASERYASAEKKSKVTFKIAIVNNVRVLSIGHCLREFVHNLTWKLPKQGLQNRKGLSSTSFRQPLFDMV